MFLAQPWDESTIRLLSHGRQQPLQHFHFIQISSLLYNKLCYNDFDIWAAHTLKAHQQVQLSACIKCLCCAAEWMHWLFIGECIPDSDSKACNLGALFDSNASFAAWSSTIVMQQCCLTTYTGRDFFLPHRQVPIWPILYTLSDDTNINSIL